MLGDWGRSEWTSVDGTGLHAAVAGPDNGPSVVLVHGLGVSHRYFRPLARELASFAAVSAPDLPGFGRTPKPPRPLDVRGQSTALAGWLRATGRSGSVLVANSAGCQFVVDLACHSPQVLGPTVLVGPTFEKGHRTVRSQVWRLAVAGAKESPSLVPVLAQEYLVTGPRRFLASLRLFLDDAVEDKAPRVDVPVVVLRGEYDALAPRRWVDDLALRFPRAHAREVPDAGHALNWTAPTPVAAVVRELTGLPADP